LIPTLTDWHNFYSLIGGAAATLVALMFVAASIGAGVFKGERQIGVRSFLSPTVVHFSAILVICLLGIVPTATWLSVGALEADAGAIGLVYSFLIWHRMIRHDIIGRIDLADRLWYLILPTAAYLMVIAAGISLWQQHQAGLDVLAIALILLLLIGIRNAWDMTIWIIDHHPQN